MIALDTMEDLISELRRTEAHGSKYASLHEAYGVLIEEVDEVFQIVKQKRSVRSSDELRKELIQVAAVAIKAISSMERFTGSEEGHHDRG